MIFFWRVTTIRNVFCGNLYKGTIVFYCVLLSSAHSEEETKWNAYETLRRALSQVQSLKIRGWID